MYVPKQFEESRTEVLHALVRKQSFGTLVVMTGDGLSVDHIPFLLDTTTEPLGVLRGHVARANYHFAGHTRGRRCRGHIPGTRSLHHPILVRDEEGDRKGRTHVELRRGPRIRTAHVHGRRTLVARARVWKPDPGIFLHAACAICVAPADVREFGPRDPWGLLFIAGRHLSMGMDSGWFISLEDAVRASMAWDGKNPPGYEVG
jgi:hypothetical protein